MKPEFLAALRSRLRGLSRLSFCFYCGVDSGPLVRFFLIALGSIVMGGVMMFLWSVTSGHWSRSEKPKYKVLEAESDES